MNGLYRLLASPQFPDDEQTRVAQWLHWLILAGTSFNLLGLVLQAIFAPETLSTAWINILGLIFSLIAFRMLRRGRVYLISIAVCLQFWALLTYNLTLEGGVTSPGFGFLGVLIILGGILLGARGAGFFGVLSMVTAVGLYWAGENGQIASQIEQFTPSRLFATNMTLLAGLTLLMAVSGLSVHNALTRARKGEQEQKRLVAILEATPDFVGITDSTGKTLYLNSAGRKLVGQPTIEALSIPDYHPLESTEKVLNEGLQTATKEGMWLGETQIVNREGKAIPVSQVVVAHRNEAGEVDFFSTIMRDISERKQAEQHRLELALQKERIEAFKEFLSNISHDLKTPMSVINNSLYLMERTQDTQRRKEKMDLIREQMVLLENYIKNLMELSRLDHTPDFKFEPVNLNTVISKVQHQFAPIAETKSLTISVELAQTDLHILADEAGLYRAIMNLIENAINYTPSGGFVEVQTYRQPDGVVAQVSDTGIGIAQDELSQVFERFFRSEQARHTRTSGTGLGLAIVKRIVDIHGGNIEVESTLGKGTTFRVWLPAPYKNGTASALPL